MNQVLNEHIQANWDEIRSELAVNERYESVFDAGRLAGEGFYNVNQGGLGPKTAVYGWGGDT